MRRWHFENVLQEEGIQFGDLPENDHLTDGEKTHTFARRVQPTHFSPTYRSELQYRSFQLTRRRAYISVTHDYVISTSITIILYDLHGQLTHSSYLMLTHLYSFISIYLQNFSPIQIPIPLQTRTSSINMSHQHSMKFGNKWAKAI